MTHSHDTHHHHRDEDNRNHRVEKLFVTGSNCIVFPSLYKLKPCSAYAKFIDAEACVLPGCNPLIRDRVCAEVLTLPDGSFGVRISWNVTGTREIEWHVIEGLS